MRRKILVKNPVQIILIWRQWRKKKGGGRRLVLILSEDILDLAQEKGDKVLIVSLLPMPQVEISRSPLPSCILSVVKNL